MTLRLRNTILIIMAAVSAAGLLLTVRELVIQGSPSIDSIKAFLPLLLIFLFSTISCISIFLSFRNTASSEIFFYIIFIFSFIFDVFRFINLFSFDSTFLSVFAMPATRFVYYGRFVGALSLFSAGLFTTGMEYQRMGITTVTILSLPAALVMILPVDVTSSVAGGTFEIGSFPEITIALSILHLIAVLNFLIAGLKNESSEYILIASSLLTAVIGRELVFYFEGWLPVLGFSLMFAGTLIFALRMHRLYLWE